MKKVFTGALLLLSSISLISKAGEGDIKNFRFGVTTLSSVNWYKPDDLKKFKNNGSTVGFGVLLNGEYSFSDNFAIGFGIGLGSGGGRIAFLDTTHYYIFDNEILPLVNPDTAGNSTKVEHFLLRSRKYKASYYVLPVSLKMRTNEIGHMRYFFEPRLNIGIRNKVRADDDVVNFGSSNAITNKDLNISTDMSPIRMSVTLSAGGEYYLTGSTALTFSLGYDYGLSNTVKGTSDYIYRTKFGTTKALEQKFTQSGVVLAIGILF